MSVHTDLFNLISQGNTNGFKELLKKQDPSKIFHIYDSLRDRNLEYGLCEDMFNVLIDIGYRGTEEMGLVRYLKDSDWDFKFSSEFLEQYILKLLRLGYDISTTESSRIDGFLMTCLIVGENNQDRVLEMLSYNPDLSCHNFDGCRWGDHPLVIACANDNPELVRILLEYGAGTQEQRLSLIENILDLLSAYKKKDVVLPYNLTTNIEDIKNYFNTTHNSNFYFGMTLEEKIERVTGLIQSLIYLRQYTFTITKSAKKY